MKYVQVEVATGSVFTLPIGGFRLWNTKGKFGITITGDSAKGYYLSEEAYNKLVEAVLL